MGGLLAQLEQRMGCIDLGAVSEAGLCELTSQLHQALARIEGYLTTVARELRTREATGAGPATYDILRDGGTISADLATTRRDRAAMTSILPTLGAATEAGTTRTENADTVAAALTHLNPCEQARLATADTEINHRASHDSPETFQRWLQRKLHDIKDQPTTDQTSPAEHQKNISTLTMGRRPTGRWWLTADLDAERGATINDLINRHARQHTNQQPPQPHQRAAALHHLITNNHTDGTPPARMSIGYILDAHTLHHGPHPHTVSETWDGHHTNPTTIQRLACDTDLYALLLNQLGTPQAIGRTHRHATREQRLALRALYPHCPIDGTTPFHHCDIHHVNLPYQHGGHTELHNLIPISQHWHHRIHDQHWTLTLHPDRTLQLNRPNGTPYRTIPPPTPITRRE